MLTLYTETFSEYVENIGGLQVFSTRFKNEFDKFPNFTLGSLNLDLYSLFIEKFDIREIGAETETLFEHFLTETLHSLQIEYIPKIQLFISQWNSLFSRKITLAENGTNTYYLQPQNITTTNLKVQDVDKHDVSRETNFSSISNAQMLEEIMKIQDIYNKLINAFQPLFMSIL